MKIETALISVYNKKGVVEFARELNNRGITILSTGGTAGLLTKNEIPVIKIEDYTGLAEILDGRVKTLNYKIFAGLLAKRDSNLHVKQIKDINVKFIDMVVVNLYPFEDMIKRKLSFEDMIEYIDIGGNTLLRAAAKNFKFVLPVYSYKSYKEIIKLMKENDNDVPFDFRLKLAKETFAETSNYDYLISNYFNTQISNEGHPDILNIRVKKEQELRYGENSHQAAALYNLEGGSDFKQLWGKELSYNNIFDFYAAANLIAELNRNFDKQACVIVKHRNPCGTALGSSIGNAYDKALAGDPVSAFGGIVVFNGIVDVKTAEKINSRFFEIVAAKNYDKEALNVLKSKRNLRILKISNFNKFLKKRELINSVNGFILVQDSDTKLYDKLEAVTKKKSSGKDIEELKFGWIVCKYVKSNAIVFTKNYQLLGSGMGQTSRIDSVKFAAEKAKNMGFILENSYLASDAFFPFKDSIEAVSKYKIKAIIQPGGSIRDAEVIETADKKKIAMIFTGTRHFNH